MSTSQRKYTEGLTKRTRKQTQVLNLRLLQCYSVWPGHYSNNTQKVLFFLNSNSQTIPIQNHDFHGPNIKNRLSKFSVAFTLRINLGCLVLFKYPVLKIKIERENTIISCRLTRVRIFETNRTYFHETSQFIRELRCFKNID